MKTNFFILKENLRLSLIDSKKWQKTRYFSVKIEKNELPTNNLLI